MPRARVGSVQKRGKLLYAVITYKDEQGVWRKKFQRADNKTDARNKCKQMMDELDTHGEEFFDAAKMTFNDLCDHYDDNYLKEAEYVNGRKVAGLRSLATPKGFLETLRAHFKSKFLRKITYGDLRAYRSARLKTPTYRETDEDGNPTGQRSITSVNRELALLRRMLNVAQREGWILKNPFHAGESLISVADEVKRERILTLDEERQLLEACGERTITVKRGGKEFTVQDRRREHLKAIIIAALDTGMRKGELLRLRWKDVDTDNREIIIRAMNTKTMRERTVPMTTRLYSELRRMREERQPAPDELVFGFDDVKRSFDGARNDAGLSDLRFHDLRHTHATRLVGAGIPVPDVARGLGHQQLSTTYRYVNSTRESARRRAEVLDAINGQGGAVEEVSTVN